MSVIDKDTTLKMFFCRLAHIVVMLFVCICLTYTLCFVGSNISEHIFCKSPGRLTALALGMMALAGIWSTCYLGQISSRYLAKVY